jgi:mRNA interferase RelE/StbE
MKTCFKPVFWRHIKKLTDQTLKQEVGQVINSVENASRIKDIPNLKKLKGYKIAYRIKVSDYRIGLTIAKGTAIFIVCLPRKDIYTFFP